MSREIIETGASPEIFIQSVAGDLVVRGWDSPQVAIAADTEEVELDSQDERVRINCSGDLDVRIPSGSTLHIDNVAGDVSVKLLEETIEIGSVAGDMELRNLAGVNINSVAGSLSVKNAEGDLNVNVVSGNADIRNVEGACRVHNVSGNLELQNVGGEVLATADGNARLRLEETTDANYSITADGNIYCYLPDEASLHLSMTSDGEVIKVRMPDSSKTYQQTQLDLTLGEGEGNMALAADGVIYLFVERAGWSSSRESAPLPEDFGQQIAEQVESQIRTQMDEVTRQLNEQMSRLTQQLNTSGLSPEETERIVEQAMRSSERETARAQEKMRRAQEKLERKLEAQRRKTESRANAAIDRRNRRSWGFDFNFPGPPRPPAPPPPPMPMMDNDPVSEEERLMILRMLEQKKISLDEANRLLSALEGKE